MENRELERIQDQIGYKFKNLDLLQQAFIRRSYAEENGGEHNEVLEFIGDKVLEFVVVKLLAQRYGWMRSEEDDYDPKEDWDEFACEKDEEELTELKAQLVKKKTLAERIGALGFADHLIMGKGDIRKHVEKSDSVKEDLFEAILGAVAIDCNYDIKELESVVELMLDPELLLDDGDENYIALVQEWTLNEYGRLPQYRYPDQNSSYFIAISYYYYKHFCCELWISSELPGFKGWGESKQEARWAAAKAAYEYLETNGYLHSIYDEIQNPNKAEAISQLEILARRGYFSIPTYDFQVEYDTNGNPVWTCECEIAEEEECFVAKSSSKKEAKKSAAYDMLKYLLDL